MRRAAILCLTAVLALQLAGCGTVLYPERRGQVGGRIDPGVAILDGLGLLLFFVPGVVAFGVDFTTGAIYLPGGRRGALVDDGTVRVVHLAPGALDASRIEQVIRDATGVALSLDDPRLRTTVAADGESLRAALAAGH